MSGIERLIAAVTLTAVASLPVAARADTVASLLGNFTINQYSGLTLQRHAVLLHYVTVFGQLPALTELHAADADHDGITSQQERDAYVGRLTERLAQSFDLRIDGAPVALTATRWSSSLPAETGGFSLRVDVFYRGALPAAAAAQESHQLAFANKNHAGRMGWNEIALTESPGLAVFDTNAYANSITGALNETLTSLPGSGPLQERAIHARWSTTAPAGAALLGNRPDTASAAKAAAPTGNSATAMESAWMAQKTRALLDGIAAPHLAPGVIATALLAALLLGAIHALSPGHGKTIVGAYLIGSRGTPRHAVFLGLTVTLTHTFGVFTLGLITLSAAQQIPPETLLPVLSITSGAMVLIMGTTMLWRRIAAAARPLTPAFVAVSLVQVPRIYAHPLLSAAPGTHSHDGGPLHSHWPPGAAGEKVTWRSLLALGISGGLVPCPSALVLLLACVALNKTAFGMLLVSAFSVGLAITLTTVGLIFLWARNRLPQARPGSRWPQLLPVMSALLITLLGVFLCLGAVQR